MFVFLSKTLPLLVYPLGLACLCIVAAMLTRRRRWQTSVLVAAFLLLWLGSSQPVSYFLVGSLEFRYVPPAEAPRADVIVVLGGATRAAVYPRVVTEINESGDRLLYAARLYREGRAPWILVSGGGIDWQGAQGIEAEGMLDVLEFLGVPAAAVIVEPEARNTYENALFTRRLLAAEDRNRILLVTSAMHMPRAVRLYERQGFEVIPAPTDYLTTQADRDFLLRMDIRSLIYVMLPDAYYLYLNSQALKEYIGILVYSARGWM